MRKREHAKKKKELFFVIDREMNIEVYYPTREERKAYESKLKELRTSVISKEELGKRRVNRIMDSLSHGEIVCTDKEYPELEILRTTNTRICKGSLQCLACVNPRDTTSDITFLTLEYGDNEKTDEYVLMPEIEELDISAWDSYDKMEFDESDGSLSYCGSIRVVVIVPLPTSEAPKQLS